MLIAVLHSYFIIKGLRSFGVLRGNFCSLPLVVRCVTSIHLNFGVGPEANIPAGHPRQNPVL